VVLEAEKEAGTLVEALVEKNGLELLVQNLQRMDEGREEDVKGVIHTLQVWSSGEGGKERQRAGGLRAIRSHSFDGLFTLPLALLASFPLPSLLPSGNREPGDRPAVPGLRHLRQNFPPPRPPHPSQGQAL